MGGRPRTPRNRRLSAQSGWWLGCAVDIVRLLRRFRLLLRRGDSRRLGLVRRVSLWSFLGARLVGWRIVRHARSPLAIDRVDRWIPLAVGSNHWLRGFTAREGPSDSSLATLLVVDPGRWIREKAVSGERLTGIIENTGTASAPHWPNDRCRLLRWPAPICNPRRGRDADLAPPLWERCQDRRCPGWSRLDKAVAVDWPLPTGYLAATPTASPTLPPLKS